jgi:hypothetical protein
MTKKTKEQLIQEELDAEVNIIAGKEEAARKESKAKEDAAKSEKKEIGCAPDKDMKLIPVGNKDEDEMDKQGVTTEERIVQAYKTPEISEDVALLFNGQELSEDFKKRATVIFEAALAARMNVEIEKVEEEAQEALKVKLAEAEEQTLVQINEYMDSIVEVWAEDNKLAIETGVRQEIAENFITDLKALFEKHNIEIPQEKVDMFEASKDEAEKLRTEIATLTVKLVESDEKMFDMEKANIIKELSEGLAVTQVEKLNSLIKEVDAKSIETFKEKALILRDSVFTEVKPSNKEEKATNKLNESDALMEKVYASMRSKD